MSKASTRQFEFITKSDPDTGARVTRLSPADTACHRTYFYQKCFSNDGNQLVFGARSGDEWHYHRLDLQTRVATQLTDQARGEHLRWLFESGRPLSVFRPGGAGVDPSGARHLERRVCL